MEQNKVKIRIDRSTFRRNPTAGNSTYKVAGRRTVTQTLEFDYVGPDSLPCRVIETRALAGTGEDFKAITGGVQVCTAIPHLPQPARIITRTEQPESIIHSLSPEGRWIFQYLPDSVQCIDCKSTFAYTRLKSYPDSDDSAISDRVCPVCGYSMCCGPIEFENADDVARELGYKDE